MDLPNADPDNARAEIEDVMGIDATDAIPCSAKSGMGVEEILEAIGHNDGPEHYLVALGCSGWNPGQLEKEITENSWFTCPASSEILFSTDFANKPNMAAATLGFTMAQLTSDVGYS